MGRLVEILIALLKSCAAGWRDLSGAVAHRRRFARKCGGFGRSARLARLLHSVGHENDIETETNAGQHRRAVRRDVGERDARALGPDAAAEGECVARCHE